MMCRPLLRLVATYYAKAVVFMVASHGSTLLMFGGTTLTFVD